MLHKIWLFYNPLELGFPWNKLLSCLHVCFCDPTKFFTVVSLWREQAGAIEKRCRKHWGCCCEVLRPSAESEFRLQARDPKWLGPIPSRTNQRPTTQPNEPNRTNPRQPGNPHGRFSYDQMLDPKGNTAVYVLYAYARIAGVLRRAEQDISSLTPKDLSLTEPSESWSELREQLRAYQLTSPRHSSLMVSWNDSKW